MIIPGRFNGPPGSGNGGYSAGRIAAQLDGDAPVQVTLRTPPPLDRELVVVRDGDGIAVHDRDGGLVAEAAHVEPFDAVVPPVAYEVAAEASAAYPGFTDHPFPTCYVCGPARDDGLRIFPGALPDGRTAAPFVTPTGAGAETVWAALDCPGGWAVIGPGRPYVLGRMAAVVRAVPAAGSRCVVLGAAVATQGRRALVHSTLYGPDGELLGHARATWVALPPPPRG
ncbi:hypothetical protein SAMN05444365_101207 [Micromonospora pattaloongensis]|uniref:Thioesterase-like superfamily protein n=1 Tax=Micromonospora pattaloongensis TaxID=405436 RepID=A0A1H3FYG3_9ACTN|nr:hypothetical protein [Micromonospora pattaloongensis]SDX96016.1 hypothetical protein SAMN05444365_101207 [Micromonospora pattaloongensis]